LDGRQATQITGLPAQTIAKNPNDDNNNSLLMEERKKEKLPEQWELFNI
jgi:hypothetical protein